MAVAGAGFMGAMKPVPAPFDWRYMSVEFDQSRLTVVDHPMVQHKLTIMRDVKTGSKQFRELVKELALFEGYEATRDFPLEDVEVTTPICTTTAKQIAGRKVAIIPILRAGLGMVDGMLELIPAARVGHVGMYRDEEAQASTSTTARFPQISISVPAWWSTPCSPPAAPLLPLLSICAARASRMFASCYYRRTRGHQGGPRPGSGRARLHLFGGRATE